ncbi:hypothetical protein HPB50_019375 [Hyalomma asiaticum]|uniref:Uncharacterized protein n=1 Tax=Hyalomma asiaticum TaxID=266040 RepID=A0ACB7SIX2_HYAAI|nr:hypothetical protein HPB50_019375 [Hyalomma asiaticum]
MLQPQPDVPPVSLKQPLQERRVSTYADMLRQPAVQNASFAAPTPATVISACSLPVALPATLFKFTKASFSKPTSGKLNTATWGDEAAEVKILQGPSAAATNRKRRLR